MTDHCPTCGQSLPPNGGSLGNMIRARRMAMHFSLRDVERVSNGKISNGYLSQIETGKVRDPAGSMLLHIAAALALDITDLLDAIEVKP